MSDPLTLARRLSSLGDEELTAILVSRPVAAREVRDFFDLADALLSPASVTLALRRVSRPALEWLASGDGTFAALPAADQRMLATDHLVEPPAAPPTRTTAPDLDAASATAPGLDPAVTSPATARPELDAASVTPSLSARGTTAGSAEPGSVPTHDAVGEPLVYDAVRDAAHAVLEAEADGHGTASVPPVAAPDAVLGSPDQRAFSAMAAVAELGHQLRLAPARVRARGGVAVTEERRLAPVLGVEPDEVGIVVELALAAGLAALENEMLLVTTRAAGWNVLSPGARWLALVTAWLAALDEPVQRTLQAAAPRWAAGAPLRTEYAELFPAASPAMRADLDRVDTVAAFLGLDDSPGNPFAAAALTALAARGGPAPGSAGDAPGEAPGNPFAAAADAKSTPDAPGSAAEAAGGALDALLPPEIGQVYLQHDLSVIAPGPLAPEIDARLRVLAEIENRGLASSYRITQATIDRALSSGETEQTLRAFLSGISLTGIPQALDYLLTEGGRRHGLVRVRQGDLTLIRSSDAVLLRALAVDQALGPLGLRPGHAGELMSRVDPVTSYWMLVDARYPAVAEDAAGVELPMNRGRVVEAPGDATAPVDAGSASGAGTAAHATAALVQSLRQADAQSADDSTAWIARQLDKAVRTRTPVSLDVRMPDGTTTHLDATPLALSNGRLRCVDVRAGVERTVPVANIVELTTH